MIDNSDLRERDPHDEMELTTADLAGRNQVPEGAQSSSRPDLERTPLFHEAEIQEFRGSWDGIQASFVDEPRRAVEQADSLVANAMKRLAEQFAEERARLEGQWDKGDDVSTEDLRLALQRYRSFFARLLSV